MTFQPGSENVASPSGDAILIALGANLPTERFGPPAAAIDAAIAALKDLAGVTVTGVSSFYETAPVPISDQPWYVNAIVRVETALAPHDLLQKLHDIEAGFGRVRVARNEARVLDLDLVAYGRVEISDEGGLVVPHPRLHERAFVLLPLRDVAADWVHPVLLQTVNDLIASLPDDQEIRQMQKT
ncbi:2-amino-4-hydroxy-6-hydroxymethyldihydropteridine diphosphokinase [Thalassospira marina]|uniref:2-amino-4-hydroxy-6-hydroxymethyldihydropteridine pyrophosphokinase n=1 Tax=Thalassospira marina TaxID=2048283 RepID=A0A2N3KJB4_9PROT|nr:2-amino-4-hydroxy-6-hydroxymethyldihydropteridine diphosphokinase [Thalassospira marina]PKR50659.1 2-amino-4-hydroxy-6-hydroxymethyldihydropteridine diphosphokinase [Thalassospira marina]